jgi:hypothetical protein
MWALGHENRPWVISFLICRDRILLSEVGIAKLSAHRAVG